MFKYVIASPLFVSVYLHGGGYISLLMGKYLSMMGSETLVHGAIYAGVRFYSG